MDTKTNCTITSGLPTITVPNNTGIAVGDKVFHTDLDNSGGAFPIGTTVTVIAGTLITVSANSTVTSSTAFLIFSDAWLTITSGAIASRTASGDTIRIKGNKPATSIGTASWILNSGLITLTTSNTQEVYDCDAAWTAVSANVTQAQDTSSHKEGTGATRFIIATGFTTGKVCYHTLSSTLDLSGYQQVCFWFKSSDASQPAGRFELKLCSDTIGNTPVNTIAIPATGTAALWQRVVVDTAANLGASIASIAIYATTDPGVQDIYLDNIFVSKNKTSDDSLTLRSLVSKQTASGWMWYAVRSVAGTTVYLDDRASGNTHVGVVETTETVTTYKFEPYVTSAGLTGGTLHTINESGTNPNVKITYSGGWDRTDMSTQTHMSWWDFQNTGSVGEFIDLNAKSYLTFERMGCTGPAQYFYDNATAGNDFISAYYCMSANTLRWYSGYRVENFYATMSGFHGGDGLIYTSNGNLTCTLKEVKCTSNGNILLQPTDGVMSVYAEKIDHTSTGLSWLLQYTQLSPPSYLFNCNLYNVSYFVLSLYADVYVINPDITTLTALANTGSPINHELKVYCTSLNNSSTDHRQQGDAITVVTDTTVKHSAQGFSWKVTPTNTTTRIADRPCKLRLPAQLFKANVPATIKAWCYRGDSDTVARFVMPVGQIPGLTADVVATLSTTGSWEQLKLQFTPTQTVVAAAEYWVYDPTSNSNSAYIDDISFS